MGSPSRATERRETFRPRHRRLRIFKDPGSAWTHFPGFIAASLAGAWLVGRAEPGAERLATAIYAATLALLFLASSLYHFFDLGERGNRWLRRLDHAAVFLLIAGTYTPILVLTLEGAWRAGMLGVVTGLALGGVLLKLFWIDAPTWLGLSLYLGLGWLGVVPLAEILPDLSLSSWIWLAAGGLAYTLGAAVYALRWPDPWPGHFGHHEVWHVFVLIGASAHYLFIERLVAA